MEQEILNIVEYVASKLPDTIYLRKNQERYEKAIESIAKIKNMICEIDDEAVMEMHPDCLLHTSLCVVFTTSLVVISMIDEFCEAIKFADNFEINVREDGLIDFGIVYQDIFDFIKPQK